MHSIGGPIVSDAKPILSLIAALASNRCIGINNKLPWYLPEDLKYFKAVTMGKPIVMGRTTFDSLGKPLPNRCNIVVTRNRDFAHPGVKVAYSLDEAIKIGESVAYIEGGDEIVIIGGANIYQQALPLVQRMYLTEVQKSVEGDAFFPEFDKTAWRESERRVFHFEPGQLDYSFVVYERV